MHRCLISYHHPPNALQKPRQSRITGVLRADGSQGSEPQHQEYRARVPGGRVRAGLDLRTRQPRDPRNFELLGVPPADLLDDIAAAWHAAGMDMVECLRRAASVHGRMALYPRRPGARRSVHAQAHHGPYSARQAPGAQGSFESSTASSRSPAQAPGLDRSRGHRVKA